MFLTTLANAAVILVVLAAAIWFFSRQRRVAVIVRDNLPEGKKIGWPDTLVGLFFVISGFAAALTGSARIKAVVEVEGVSVRVAGVLLVVVGTRLVATELKRR